jgi:hypothetical protein
MGLTLRAHNPSVGLLLSLEHVRTGARADGGEMEKVAFATVGSSWADHVTQTRNSL